MCALPQVRVHSPIQCQEDIGGSYVSMVTIMGLISITLVGISSLLCVCVCVCVMEEVGVSDPVARHGELQNRLREADQLQMQGDTEAANKVSCL